LKVSTQYTDGLTGGFVVHPSNAAGQQPKNFPTWDGEIMVQMANLYHNFSQVLGAAYLSVCTLLWLMLDSSLEIFASWCSKPNGMDGNPGDEPVPDAGVHS
jgi:hypothetical protein